jgi:hypothetical protein
MRDHKHYPIQYRHLMRTREHEAPEEYRLIKTNLEPLFSENIHKKTHSVPAIYNPNEEKCGEQEYTVDELESAPRAASLVQKPEHAIHVSISGAS